MTRKEGELLKNWVERKGYEGQEIADILGIARTSIYYVYKGEVLSKEYKEKLDKHGFSVDEEINVLENSQKALFNSQENEIFKLQGQIDLLSKQMMELQSRLSIHELNIKELQTVTFKKKSEKRVQGK